MPTFEEHIDAIESQHTTLLVERDAALAEKTKLEQTIVALTARIKELEAPPPATPPAPTTNTPKILNETFKNGVDWARYFSDSGGGPAAPRERFAPTPEGLKVIWIAGSPSGTKRSELGIRAVVGGGETPRRDPIGSERWYGLEFFLPDAYKLDDARADGKRVIWQCHQQGGSNPSLSL